MVNTITKLKQERLKRGWSQQDLGYHARVNVADVSRIENGRLRPYDGQAERLANIVGLRPEELQQPAEQTAAVNG